MSTQQYFCDCQARCKTRKAVSRATYYNHAKFRQPLSEDFNSFAALHRVDSEASMPSSSGHDLDSSFIGPGHKRGRPWSVDEEDGQESNNDGFGSGNRQAPHAFEDRNDGSAGLDSEHEVSPSLCHFYDHLLEIL